MIHREPVAHQRPQAGDDVVGAVQSDPRITSTSVYVEYEPSFSSTVGVPPKASATAWAFSALLESL